MVRRIAVALRADDHEEATFLLERALRVSIRAEQTSVHTPRAQVLSQLRRDVSRMTGLAAVQHRHEEGRLSLGRWPGNIRGGHALLPQTGQVSGQPHHGGTVHASGKLAQQPELVVGQW